MAPPKPLVAFVILLISGSSYYAYQEWHQPLASGILVAGTLEATEIPLASPLGGRLETVMIKEGQTVKKDQPLMRFDVAELEQQAQQAHAMIRAAQARIRLLQAGSRSEDIQGADVTVKMAQTRLKQLLNGSRPAEIERMKAEVTAQQSKVTLATKEVKRLTQLQAQSAAPEQVLDQAKQSLQLAQAGLQIATQNLRLIQEGPRPEEIQLARQQLQQAQMQWRKLRNGPRSQEIEEAMALLDQHQASHRMLQIRLREKILKAACHCTVSIVDGEVGELISRGTPVVTLIDTQNLWVKVYISPLELTRIRLNQQVQLYLDAAPQKKFSGKVIYRSPKAEFTPRNVQTHEERMNQVFAVKIAVANPSGTLYAGMPVMVEFP